MAYRTRIFTEPTPEPVPEPAHDEDTAPAAGIVVPFAAEVLRDSPGLGQGGGLADGFLGPAVVVMRPVTGAGYRGPDGQEQER